MIRDAASQIAAQEAAASRRALDDIVGATRSKLVDLEEMAEKGIARITGK
ncbi:hypothetical protein HFP89_07785 [Wenzhouxiangella sp. XN79A]|nr:hypothetical protein [Wenzhouxiangella sp. XN79A]NKI35064.1 hypothetical protein [Wenzhouxiangella sp. XN79A]